MNNPDNAINKQQVGKTMPRYLFVISCSLISFQKLLSSNFLINYFMFTHRTHTHDTTLIYILKPYAQVERYKARANNLGLQV